MKRYVFILVIIILLFFVGYYFNFIGQNFSLLFLKPVNRVSYLCKDNKNITASFYLGKSIPSSNPDMPPTPGGKVKISLSDGRKMILPQTISASGVRYANTDETFVFWTKGDGALVLENNEEKSYIGCIAVSGDIKNSDFTGVYANSQEGFTLRLPGATKSSPYGGYTIDESYKYQLSPSKVFYGVKFTIPESMKAGTNLSSDTYLSIESIPQTRDCSATLFLDSGKFFGLVQDNNKEYSLASSTGAGAGNRYEEIVYAFPGTNPCLAVRYFIHYSAIENYDPGTVREFDRGALLSAFDSIRRSVVINQ